MSRRNVVANAALDQLAGTDTLTPADVMAIARWSVGPDVGLSSKTIAAIALGVDPGGDTAEPADVSDFGRCLRLVRAIPALRPHLPRVAALVPGFRPIVRNWDELAQLYDLDRTWDGACNAEIARMWKRSNRRKPL